MKNMNNTFWNHVFEQHLWEGVIFFAFEQHLLSVVTKASAQPPFSSWQG